MKNGKRSYGVVIGFPYYGRYLARLVNEQSSTWHLEYRGESYAARLRSLLEMGSCGALICFGGPGPDSALAEAARRNNVPVIVIWAGSDVQTAASDPGFMEVMKHEGHINIADGAWLVDELRELGIVSSYVPVTAVRAAEHPAPLPQTFRVVAYLPEPRRTFYGEKAVYAVARACPEVEFLVVGDGDANPAAPANVRFLGYVSDMAQVLDDSSALLRLPQHDGKSMLVLETLARARHVVWTYQFPGVRRAETLTDAIAAVRELEEMHRSGTLDINREGYEYVRERFSRETIARDFERTLESAHASVKNMRAPRKHSVAISGYPFFSAQLARGVQATLPDWEPQILRGGARLERLVSAYRLLRSNVWYSIGSPIPDRWLHLIALLVRKPRVIHWVGSDIELLKTQPAIRRFCARPDIAHLAEVDWMIEELAAFGVRARLAPLPPKVSMPASIPPLPRTFTLLLYVPVSRGDFYGRREYERLVRASIGKPIKFVVVGGGTLFAPPGSDVENLGWKTDLSGVYENVSALVRFTRHDGLSLMALEALCYGRHLIWSRDFSYGTHVRTYAELHAAVEEMFQRHLRGELHPQHDAAHYVAQTYDEGRCVERIAQYWNGGPAAPARKLAVEAPQ